ncbi:MAG: hypothetical protein M3065_16210 [Actinomycetota bacterium]|nr:hypothetical protein [Actinomycetota bacterium]
MTALTPALALQYLAELEPALEAVAIAGTDGAPLAGDPSLPARLAVGGGAMVVGRGPRHVVIAQIPRGALEGLVRHDLEAVARDLG